MAAATSTAYDPSTEVSPGARLFGYKALRGGSIVMVLSGFQADAQSVRVEAEIYSVRPGADDIAQQRSHVFPNRDLARKFADETRITFEYLGCTIKDTNRAHDALIEPERAKAA